MGQKRVLILDEEALVMVVDKDVVHQVDDNRGEMTRTEFVNFLIQSQLKKGPQHQDFINREEFYHFVQETKTFLRSFLEFFLTWGLEMEDRRQNQEFNDWLKKIQSLSESEPAGEAPEQNPSP